VGTGNATEILKEGQEITVDGREGKVYSGKVEIAESEVLKGEKTEEGSSNLETITEVKTIVDLPEIAEKAAKTGADGVGLLRVEFLILNMPEHPFYMITHGKKEEFVTKLANDLRIIATAFKGKPVWYRTMDAPTDEFRKMKGGETEPEEDNPMMGWRSIRRDLDQPEMLLAQFEAIKKLHDEGLTNIGVMIPLVTHVEQIIKAKEYLRKAGLEPLEEIEFGIMVETPAAVQIIEDICKEGIDFVSFGTNDLTQFTLAIDRNNGRIAKLYDEMHPAVLKQIKHVIEVCKEYNVETSMCGQAASRLDMAEWLVKTGIDSISPNIDAVSEVRRVVYRTEKRLLLGAARDKLNE
ncbi:MAG: aldolase/citrate lyase family protein, partial [Candidatus Nanoarchaeia archaeon]|nr:aldolase/citrate lyase family protein [Candidatus Nanoarchaeia archaeon]